MEDTWQRMVMLCCTALRVESPEEAEEKGDGVKNVKHGVVSRGPEKQSSVYEVQCTLTGVGWVCWEGSGAPHRRRFKSNQHPSWSSSFCHPRLHAA